MQMADIAMLGVDAAVGGIDQRKIHMLAREHLPNFGFPSPVCIHTPILNGLDGKKMSSSQGNYISVADSEEEIRKKCQRAFCPPETAENPVLQIFQYHIFPRLPEIVLKRPEKFGGNRYSPITQILKLPTAKERFIRLISKKPVVMALWRSLPRCATIYGDMKKNIRLTGRGLPLKIEEEKRHSISDLLKWVFALKMRTTLKSARMYLTRSLSLPCNKLVHKKWLTAIGGSISTGKEANVFFGEREDASVAIKIYRIQSANFTTMSSYITGDRRFSHVKKSKKELVFAWTRKEFSNLARAKEAGLPVPEPLVWDRNILIMSFLGDGECPYPQLRSAEIDNPARVYENIMAMIDTLYNKAELVHGDLSEFNILYSDQPYLIDMGQSVTRDHPRALQFLMRDIRNMNRFFKKRGCEVKTEYEIFNSVTGRNVSQP